MRLAVYVVGWCVSCLLRLGIQASRRFGYACRSLGNSIFTVLNKQAMLSFGLPCMVSWLQMVVGVMWIVPMWSIGYRPAPLVDARFFISKFGPIGFLHAAGHSSQVKAIGAGTALMVTLVKATEPIIGTLVTLVVSGTWPLRLTNLSLLVIVTGVFIGAFKPGRSHFSATDILTVSSGAALFSTVVFVLAKVLAKRLMTPDIKRERQLDPANNYALLSCASCIFLALPAFVFDGPTALRMWQAFDHQKRYFVAQRIAFSGLAYYASNECSFRVLDVLGPVSQAVANAAKRIAVLFAAVIFLGETVTVTEAAGSAISLFGVLCYSLSKTSVAPLSQKRAR